MLAHIYQENSKHHIEERAPICGVFEAGKNDYCSECGDCLKCYAEDDCGGVPGKAHRWEINEPSEGAKNGKQ